MADLSMYEELNRSRGRLRQPGSLGASAVHVSGDLSEDLGSATRFRQEHPMTKDHHPTSPAHD